MTLYSEQIRAARALLRMDQAELARRASVSVETVMRLERLEGEVRAEPETIWRIRSALLESGVELIEPGQPLPAGGSGIRKIRDLGSVNLGVVMELMGQKIPLILFDLMQKDAGAFRKSPAEMIDASIEAIAAKRDEFIWLLDMRIKAREQAAKRLAGSDGEFEALDEESDDFGQ